LAFKWQKSYFQDGHLEPGGHKIGQNKSKKALGLLPKGILTPNFIEIALAVTKRALLTDDDDNDRRHVIAIELKTKVS
jgi:hypothetical protein